MKLSSIVALTALSAAVTFAHSAFAQVIKSGDGVMTDGNGKTLYYYTKDAANQSNCTGGCLAAWPVFTAKPEAKPTGDLGVITREDGTRQWTYKSRPLYYYIGDSKAGEKTGDKQGGVWYVLPYAAESKPAAAVSGY
jgi:predicted lipoprotein with Yx(FWY)xxD motif